MNLEDWERWVSFATNLVTLVGFPFAIGVFIYEKRKEALNEDYEVYQRLSDEYAGFQRLILENIDLRLSTDSRTEGLDENQRLRMYVIFDLLVSIFERAFILVYAKRMSKQRRRMWGTWEDYIREWCRRDDFLTLLPQLLKGEDPEFQCYLGRIVREEKGLEIGSPAGP